MCPSAVAASCCSGPALGVLTGVAFDAKGLCQDRVLSSSAKGIAFKPGLEKTTMLHKKSKSVTYHFFGLFCCDFRLSDSPLEFSVSEFSLEWLAEWIHCPLVGTISPTIKLKVHTFWGL